jgi:eukaryotic translation initiation factor 2-alpha kinase 3
MLPPSKFLRLDGVLVKGADPSICSNNSEFSTSSAPTQSIAALASGIQSIQFDVERDLSNQFKRERRSSLTEEDPFDSSIVFSNSGSNKPSKDSHKTKNKPGSANTTKSMFRKPGEHSDSTGDATDEVEEIPRVEIAKPIDVDGLAINEDFILFIKMTPYPLTLDEFIVSKLPIGTFTGIS